MVDGWTGEWGLGGWSTRVQDGPRGRRAMLACRTRVFWSFGCTCLGVDRCQGVGNHKEKGSGGDIVP